MRMGSWKRIITLRGWLQGLLGVSCSTAEGRNMLKMIFFFPNQPLPFTICFRQKPRKHVASKERRCLPGTIMQ